MQSFGFDDDFIYNYVCWLVIDKLHRGAGLTGEIHDELEKQAQDIGKTLKGNWCLQLMSGINNPGHDIYLKIVIGRI